jgi:phosphoribosylcarboxyaminoimidazole (NCAIR) mutase
MLAVEMLAISDARLKKMLANTKKENNLKVQKQNEELKKRK